MAEPTAAVAILHAIAPSDSVLLMRRAERANDPWSGHWSFPGGRRDPGDRDLMATAIRELREECAVDLAHTHLGAVLPPSVARRRTGPYLLVAPYVFTLDSELDAVPDLDEAVEARWVPLSLLRDPAQHRLRPIPGLAWEMLFPTIELPGFPLWGFTYRLITEWLDLVPKGEARSSSTGREVAEGLLRFLEVDDGGGTIEPGLTIRIPGPIPTEAVRRYLMQPGASVPQVNVIELQTDSIRIAGLDFEEYRIEAI